MLVLLGIAVVVFNFVVRANPLLVVMAADFNVVPANLLEPPESKAALNGVIRAQIPTAVPPLIANILLIRFRAFSQ